MDPPAPREDCACVAAIGAEVPAAFRLPALGPASWPERPVAVALHPVHWDYFDRLHTLTEERAASKPPNGTLNALLVEADIHWRLLQATGAGLPLDTEQEDRWLAGAEAASLLGVNALVEETFARAPGLDVIRTMADTVVSPSIEIQGRADGKVHVRHPTGGRAVREKQQADEELRPDLVRQPRVGFGLGWKLRPDDAPEDDPLIQWGAWLDLANVGLTNLRGEYDFVQDSWTVTARRRIAGDLYANASLRSVEKGYEPGRWSAGLSILLPVDRRWTLRLDRTDTIGGGDVTWKLTLRAELGAWLPGRLDPPLARWPSIPPHDPNEIAPDATSSSAAQTSCCRR